MFVRRFFQSLGCKHKWLSPRFFCAERRNLETMGKITFSGHESFQCKSLWLKKGYDYLISGNAFNSDDAVVTLGVGKNMVASIRFWLKSFGIIAEGDQPTELGNFLFQENGADPFIEDISTLWLLHYQLVKSDHATLYNLLFSEFHKTRNEFTKAQLLSYVKRHFTEEKISGFILNENTVSKDIDTFLKNYVVPQQQNNYEDFSTLLLPLNLIRRVDKVTFAFNDTSRTQLSPFVFLYALKDVANGDCVLGFDTILELCRIFCLSTNDLYEIFEKLNQWNSAISFDNAAGEQLFSMNDGMDKMQILKHLYQDNL